MSYDDIPRLLGELKASAEALNEQLGSVNEIITGVEKQLQGLDLAVEVWLEDSPLRVKELSVSASNVAPNVEVQLGYAPLRRGGQTDWRLQLRHAEYSPRLSPSGEYHERELMRVHKTVNVIDASREDLLTSLAHLAALIRRLTETARDRAQTIRNARELLE